MTVLVSEIMDRVDRLLQDPNGLKWSMAERLLWLNDGLRQISATNPTATNAVAVVRLTAGSRQYIPSDGWLLLSVSRNMGTNGTTPGRAIRIISRELLDSYSPNWHTDTASAVTKHFLYDIQDQTSFWVYPPSNGSGYIELNYSRQPAPLTTQAQAIPVFDIYAPALVDYIVYRAHSKSAEYCKPEVAAAAYQAFAAAVGVKSQAETANTPEQQFLPRDPTTPGRTT